MVSQARNVSSRALSRRQILQFAGIAGMGAMLTACGGGGTEDYPDGAIEYMIPYNPGGSTDPLGREFASMLAKALGTSSTPMNKPGGDESIGIADVVRAKPDGYTLGMCSSAGLVGQPKLNASLPYKGPEDVTPILKMVDVPYALMVKGDSEFTTLAEFVEAAKERPGELRISSPNRMGGSAFTLYALESLAGIKTTLVPSTGGSGEAALAVMGGRVTGMIGTAAGQRGLIEAGDMKALAFTGSDDYVRFLPDAVSFREAGYDIPFSGDYMTFAPKGMDETLLTKIKDAALEVAGSDEWAAWCENQSILPDSLSGSEMEAWLGRQSEAMDKAIEIGQEHGA